MAKTKATPKAKAKKSEKAQEPAATPDRVGFVTYIHMGQQHTAKVKLGDVLPNGQKVVDWEPGKDGRPILAAAPKVAPKPPVGRSVSEGAKPKAPKAPKVAKAPKPAPLPPALEMWEDAWNGKVVFSKVGHYYCSSYKCRRRKGQKDVTNHFLNAKDLAAHIQTAHMPPNGTTTDLVVVISLRDIALVGHQIEDYLKLAHHPVKPLPPPAPVATPAPPPPAPVKPAPAPAPVKGKAKKSEPSALLVHWRQTLGLIPPCGVRNSLHVTPDKTSVTCPACLTVIKGLDAVGKKTSPAADAKVLKHTPKTKRAPAPPARKAHNPKRKK